MKNILAIETSSEACSLALGLGRKEKFLHEVNQHKHTERLLGLIQNLMQDQKLNFKELHAIAVGCGPGSFTGVRLACAVAQGLSYSSDIPVIKVSSLEIMAEHFHKKYQAQEVVILINAHMNQIYMGRFYYKDQLVSSSEVGIPIQEFTPNDFGDNTYFAGDGCGLVKEKLNKYHQKVYKHYPNALDLLAIARKKLDKGETIFPQNLIPVYLTGEEHWKKS